MSLEMRMREFNDARVQDWQDAHWTFPILNKGTICAVVMLVALHVFNAIIPAVSIVITTGFTIWNVRVIVSLINVYNKQRK